MKDWKPKLIDAYRLLTAPYRCGEALFRRRAGTVPVYVLFYHRVADTHPNPWTINSREFQRQIDWLEQRFQIVDLEECQRRIDSGFNDQPTLAITFDDGYAENCEFALPMLIERRIPVTYFVTLEHTKNQKPFPHDVEAGTPLAVNSIESLRALNMAGVEIAAHSRNHVDLKKVTDPEVLTDEVITASRELEDLIGSPVRYFAFPYGQPENLNSSAFNLLKKAGFKAACTTIKGWNEIGSDSFQLARLHGDSCFSRMRNWLTYDPRISAAEPFLCDVEIPVVPEKKAPPILFPETDFSTPLASASDPLTPNV